MISLIQTLPIGNALRVFLNPPAGASQWKLLRNTVNTFTGHNDPAAAVVLDTESLRQVLDRSGLANGTTYYYKPYSLTGAVWTGHDSVAAVPEASLLDASIDALSIVRERIEMGMQAEITAGRLKHNYNRIPVLTAPPLFEDTRWPVITVHLDDDSPAEHGIGMELVPDQSDGDDVTEFEGYLSSVRLNIVAWSLNPDERAILRKALKRVVLGNAQVFDDAGMTNIVTAFTDTEDFQSFSAPVYQSLCRLSCLAPSAVSGSIGTIDEVDVEINVDLAPA
jgi:hypothetical protein